jgi:hypothetical protein
MVFLEIDQEETEEGTQQVQDNSLATSQNDESSIQRVIEQRNVNSDLKHQFNDGDNERTEVVGNKDVRGDENDGNADDEEAEKSLSKMDGVEEPQIPTPDNRDQLHLKTKVVDATFGEKSSVSHQKLNRGGARALRKPAVPVVPSDGNQSFPSNHRSFTVRKLPEAISGAIGAKSGRESRTQKRIPASADQEAINRDLEKVHKRAEFLRQAQDASNSRQNVQESTSRSKTERGGKADPINENEFFDSLDSADAVEDDDSLPLDSSWTAYHSCQPPHASRNLIIFEVSLCRKF